jgi:hypothetical protein
MLPGYNLLIESATERKFNRQELVGWYVTIKLDSLGKGQNGWWKNWRNITDPTRRDGQKRIHQSV